ncbi:MAG: MurR/RpiR family transcriptional regulator [Breznakia sp.]
MSFSNDLSTIALIDSMSNQFTKTDWKIVQFIKKEPDLFVSFSAAEIASKIGISDASIIRFGQKLGFDGFYELRTRYKRELENADNIAPMDQNALFENDYLLAIKRLFHTISKADTSQFIEHLEKAESIYVCAFKQNHYMAKIFADKFLLLAYKIKGITSMNEFSLYAQHAKKQDLFIILDINTDYQALKIHINTLNMLNASVILINDLKKGNLNQYSVLHFLIPKTTDLFSEYAISTNTFILILIDILFDSLLRSNPSKHSITLAQSIELTKNEEEIKFKTNKLRAMFEK